MESLSETLSSLVSIVLINLVLSGDNALVIGMAAHRLPPAQRRWAIAGGAGAAIVLRVALTIVASLLLEIRFLELLGGAVLLWVAFKLLHEEEAEQQHSTAANLRDAISTIVVADVVMSLDNILGVAGAARGQTGMLLFGLVLSMALVMFGGGVIASILNRLPWLAYVAAAVIAWTGADMMLHDQALHLAASLPAAAAVGVPLVVALATVTVAHWVHRRPQRLAPGT